MSLCLSQVSVYASVCPCIFILLHNWLHWPLDGQMCFVDLDHCLKLSLGDARAYYLSTAKNELGVVSAQSPAGNSHQNKSSIIS